MTQTRPRLLAFETIRNFRDFGGYESCLGGRVKMGRLYRSGHHAEASEDELAKMDALGIHVQADLRRPDEREKQKSRFAAPVTITHEGGRETEAPHMRFLSQVGVDAETADLWMTEYYELAPFKAHHVAMFSDWFVKLAEAPGETAGLVNCAAGKDRTGILCALTHHVLGVSEADIRADYDLTNQAVGVDQRLPEAAAYFNQMLGKTYPAEVYRPFMGVHLKYLDRAYAAIHAKTGTVDAYLTDVLGVDAALHAELRAKLIEA
ncbi:MAG: tyrosine-protein phosphatase [Hyphomonas sp.]|uniref:tyrosine-protein phosphatase n=1 Tax=Hyphomonas sp. TaxID=87 RepID=UPI00184F9D1C|nr:tyrosine-protein phosphatase [Hyphomonas sp.]MBA3068913.1 tyrosine-protein phosphatase [Hyphomonas sp.]MBU4061089.1 tyrosine-protein phosphatase [Alphaproteobacteria bacterium]MBU4162813.1 tyrosine-protein phosphatase [Alphaproteobacteria bacterium]MBU4568314.1 tyrosine-protein phosphatase [Alphaproteobacteria bacterium]